jgi:hypothetical protein
MFRKITIALLASTLIAVPVFAQSTMSTARAPATQPAKIFVVKTTTNTNKPVFAKAHAVHKVAKVMKHKVKKINVAKHAKHMTVKKHVIHLSAKPATPAHHN